MAVSLPLVTCTRREMREVRRVLKFNVDEPLQKIRPIRKHSIWESTLSRRLSRFTKTLSVSLMFVDK